MSLEYNAISRDALIEEIQKLPADFMFTTFSTRLGKGLIDASGVSTGRGRHVYFRHKIDNKNISPVVRSLPPDVKWRKL